MTDIRELFADAAADAAAGAPPSRLSARAAYAKGRARWRRRRAGFAAALAGTGVAVILAGVFMVPGTRGSDVIGSGDPARVQWAGLADSDHLFMIRNACVPEPVPTCDRLYASTDGGATWEQRAWESTVLVGATEVLNRDTLVTGNAWSGPTAASGQPVVGRISTDAGRTWQDLRRDDTPAAEVPPGGAVSHRFSVTRVEVVDPTARTVRPLANQPDLLSLRLQRADGAVWVAGFDPVSHRPAVAVSHDGGRNWTTRELPDAPPDPTVGVLVGGPQVASWDGTIAYAVLPPDVRNTPSITAMPTEEITLSTYRTTDGGDSWQLVEPPWKGGWASSPQMTADGRLVMQFLDHGGQVGVHDGAAFTVTFPPGLTEVVGIDGRIATNWDVVFVTDDGWTWREVWRSGVCHLCVPTGGPPVVPTGEAPVSPPVVTEDPTEGTEGPK